MFSLSLKQGDFFFVSPSFPAFLLACLSLFLPPCLPPSVPLTFPSSLPFPSQVGNNHNFSNWILTGLCLVASQVAHLFPCYPLCFLDSNSPSAEVSRVGGSSGQMISWKMLYLQTSESKVLGSPLLQVKLHRRESTLCWEPSGRKEIHRVWVSSYLKMHWKHFCRLVTFERD